jgi:hypothetical protein
MKYDNGRLALLSAPAETLATVQNGHRWLCKKRKKDPGTSQLLTIRICVGLVLC